MSYIQNTAANMAGSVYRTYIYNTAAGQSIGDYQLPYANYVEYGGTTITWPPKPVDVVKPKKIKQVKPNLGKQTKMRLPSSKELNDLIGK